MKFGETAVFVKSLLIKVPFTKSVASPHAGKVHIALSIAGTLIFR